jgi:hypothetical protein
VVADNVPDQFAVTQPPLDAADRGAPLLGYERFPDVDEVLTSRRKTRRHGVGYFLGPEKV